MLHTWQFALVLLVGALVLAILFISRRHCRKCGKIFHVAFFWRVHDLCRNCDSGDGFSRGENIASIAVPLLCLALLIGYSIEILSARVAAVLFLVSIVARKNSRQAMMRRLRRLARLSERLDFRAARRASGHSGEVRRADGFTIWTDCPGDWISSVSTINARTAEKFSRLTGIPAMVSRPVRILCFAKEAALARYTAEIFPHFGRAGGYYQGRLRKKVVLFLDMWDVPPFTFESKLAHELTHHFTRCNLRARPLWLQEGLAELVSERAGDATVSDAPAQRRLKAALARRQLLTGRELFEVGYVRLYKRSKDWRNLEDASYFGRFYTQSAALLAWLRRKDEEGFKRFFAGLARTHRWIPVFRSCFSQSPDEALGGWKEVLRSQPLLPLPAVPPALEQRVREQLLPVIADTAAARDERVLATRLLGGGGYICGAETLIAVLENPADNLGPEAQRALENMTGELLGADAGAWRRWMLSLGDSPPAARTAV